MKAVTIILPEPIFSLMLAKAQKEHVDVATLCSGVITEQFLEEIGEQAPARPGGDLAGSKRSLTLGESTVFDVDKHFPNFHSTSKKLAQQVVNTALKIKGVAAFESNSGRGVGFEPNFCWIEYLQKRQGGIAVSFYGSPESLQCSQLRPGRNANYSRADAHNAEQLEPLLELIPRAYQLKFGHWPF